jgi:hypothetical protein
MGDEGRRALRTLFDRGVERGLIEPVGSIELI